MLARGFLVFLAGVAVCRGISSSEYYDADDDSDSEVNSYDSYNEEIQAPPVLEDVTVKKKRELDDIRTQHHEGHNELKGALKGILNRGISKPSIDQPVVDEDQPDSDDYLDNSYIIKKTSIKRPKADFLYKKWLPTLRTYNLRPSDDEQGIVVKTSTETATEQQTSMDQQQESATNSDPDVKGKVWKLVPQWNQSSNAQHGYLYNNIPHYNLRSPTINIEHNSPPANIQLYIPPSNNEHWSPTNAAKDNMSTRTVQRGIPTRTIQHFSPHSNNKHWSPTNTAKYNMLTRTVQRSIPIRSDQHSGSYPVFTSTEIPADTFQSYNTSSNNEDWKDTVDIQTAEQWNSTDDYQYRSSTEAESKENETTKDDYDFETLAAIPVGNRKLEIKAIPRASEEEKVLPKMVDIEGILDIISNLTYDYGWDLTDKIRKSFRIHGIPVYGGSTESGETEVMRSIFSFNFGNTTTVSKCFVCGLKDAGIPRNSLCSDAFAGDLLPLLPVDIRAKRKRGSFKKYCRYLDVNNFVENPAEPRAIYGRFTGGCTVRWADVTGVYTQRTCRCKNQPLMGKHSASTRMAKLELALQNVDNGCIISPMATLLPVSRDISLYARFHACVCSSNWCNVATHAQSSLQIIVLACSLTYFT